MKGLHQSLCLLFLFAFSFMAVCPVTFAQEEEFSVFDALDKCNKNKIMKKTKVWNSTEQCLQTVMTLELPDNDIIKQTKVWNSTEDCYQVVNTTLNLAHQGITSLDVGFEQVPHPETVTYIDLSGNPFTHFPVEVFDQFPNLESVTFPKHLVKKGMNLEDVCQKYGY